MFTGLHLTAERGSAMHPRSVDRIDTAGPMPPDWPGGSLGVDSIERNGSAMILITGATGTVGRLLKAFDAVAHLAETTTTAFTSGCRS
jgi:hypothetical protein